MIFCWWLFAGDITFAGESVLVAHTPICWWIAHFAGSWQLYICWRLLVSPATDCTSLFSCDSRCLGTRTLGEIRHVQESILDMVIVGYHTQMIHYLYRLILQQHGVYMTSGRKVCMKTSKIPTKTSQFWMKIYVFLMANNFPVLETLNSLDFPK